MQDAFEHDVLLGELVEERVVFEHEPRGYFHGEGGFLFIKPFLATEQYLPEVTDVAMDRLGAVTGFPADLPNTLAFEEQLADDRLFYG